MQNINVMDLSDLKGITEYVQALESRLATNELRLQDLVDQLNAERQPKPGAENVGVEKETGSNN